MASEAKKGNDVA